MNHIISLTILLSLFLSALAVSTTTFCSSSCSTCTSPAPSDCTLCQLPLISSNGVCSASNQASIFTQELQMYSSFSPTGYQSSSLLSVIKCTGLYDYYMLGTAGGNSFIQKQFTGLGTNHYQVSVLYGYALMGSTPWSQSLVLNVINGAGVTVQDTQTPACTPDGLTGCSWSAGCYAAYSITVTHSTDSLTLNFTLPSALSGGQAWGIRDITIVLSTCDPSCGSCSSNSYLNCLTCAAGLYFSGSICVSTCPYYTLPATNQCVLSCPAYYFLNTGNNYCEACPAGCSVCTAPDTCLTWDAGIDSKNMLTDFLPAWIILAIFGLTLMGLLIWRLALAKKSFYSSMEEEVIDHKPVVEEPKAQPISQSHQLMDTHWIQDIDDLHMTKVAQKKSKDTIQGIGHPNRS